MKKWPINIRTQQQKTAESSIKTFKKLLINIKPLAQSCPRAEKNSFITISVRVAKKKSVVFVKIYKLYVYMHSKLCGSLFCFGSVWTAN